MAPAPACRSIPRYIALVALAVVAAACSGTGEDAADRGIKVIATTTILGDVVANIVGDDADLEVVIPVGADPHDYQASSRQVAALQQADLVIANGLGLEQGLNNVLASAAADGANVVEIAEQLDPRPFAPGAGIDPHVWLDPVRMADAARVIGRELEAIDQTIDWSARADAYAGDLMMADGQIRRLLADVPLENRRLVTNHDSLGYFAQRYQLEVMGAVVPGGTTLAEPSSAALASLVELMQIEDIRVIFSENTEPAAVAEAVAAEVGPNVSVVELFTGSLGGPGSGVETLIDLLLTNAMRIAGALA